MGVAEKRFDASRGAFGVYGALLAASGVLLVGLIEVLQLFRQTALFRPFCLVICGLGLVVHRGTVLVRARGGPIAFLPAEWRDWVLTTTPLEAASVFMRVVDFQHWLGVFIHTASALRLDDDEKAAFIAELPPKVRDWITTRGPGVCRFPSLGRLPETSLLTRRVSY